ncbi:uncharacterized protein LOC135839852 [Planococcus citri]|uniref:uncharacterized protein LOC135839852 n=1 Tax=Planococcus citri TaxID=170843 RepID=UPI0031F8100C
MKIENKMTMKMKLNPELSCLEAQEKFWRGKFKEINEKFAEERRKMETLFIQITAENERLKNDLNELSLQSSKCSVSVQTSPIDNETDVICKYCQRPLVKTRTVFPKQKDFREKLKEDKSKSEFFIDNDLILRENTTFSREKDHCDDEYNNKINVERTITKLFSTNDHSESQKIANKLVELYEKRSKSVPDLVYEETETDYENSLEAGNRIVVQDDSDCSRSEILETNDLISSDDSEKISILNEPTYQPVETSKYSKRKNGFLPTVRNIRKKMFRNLSKIKRTCTDIKLTDTHMKSDVKIPNGVTSSSNVSNKLEKDISNSKLQSPHKTRNEEARLEELQTSTKCQLISAMKKSKSTGNIVKKVAFSDDLPSMKTVSESNLFQVDDYRFKRQSDAKPLLVGSVQVHRDKFNRPIPAPRFRKNIVDMNSS